MNDVVKTTVYLKDMGDFQEMNDVFRRQFTDGYPARMTATSEFLDAECPVIRGGGVSADEEWGS